MLKVENRNIELWNLMPVIMVSEAEAANAKHFKIHT